jgi:hypothetical protein
MRSIPTLPQMGAVEISVIEEDVTRLLAYDPAMEAFPRSPDAAGQVAVASRMSGAAATYGPIIPAIFRLENAFVQPWVKAFSPPIFKTNRKYLDLDLGRQRQAGAR